MNIKERQLNFFEHEEFQNFHYSDESIKNISFQLISSDKELMNKMSQILKQKGYIGIWDKTGEMNFIFDLRNSANLYSVADRICELVTNNQITNKSDFADKYVRMQAIQNLMEAKGFSINLRGTKYLAYILLRLSYDPNLISCLSKGLYLELAKMNKCSVKLIDRSIRYTLQKQGSNSGNIQGIQILYYELCRLIGLSVI